MTKITLLTLLLFTATFSVFAEGRSNPFVKNDEAEQNESSDDIEVDTKSEGLSKRELYQLKKLLAALKIPYKGEKTHPKILAYLNKLKTKYSTINFKAKTRAVSFNGYSDWSEGLGGFSFFGNKDAKFGTNTRCGYFQKKGKR